MIFICYILILMVYHVNTVIFGKLIRENRLCLVNLVNLQAIERFQHISNKIVRAFWFRHVP